MKINIKKPSIAVILILALISNFCPAFGGAGLLVYASDGVHSGDKYNLRPLALGERNTVLPPTVRESIADGNRLRFMEFLDAVEQQARGTRDEKLMAKLAVLRNYLATFQHGRHDTNLYEGGTQEISLGDFVNQERTRYDNYVCIEGNVGFLVKLKNTIIQLLQDPAIDSQTRDILREIEKIIEFDMRASYLTGVLLFTSFLLDQDMPDPDNPPFAFSGEPAHRYIFKKPVYELLQRYREEMAMMANDTGFLGRLEKLRVFASGEDNRLQRLLMEHSNPMVPLSAEFMNGIVIGQEDMPTYVSNLFTDLADSARINQAGDDFKTVFDALSDFIYADGYMLYLLADDALKQIAANNARLLRAAEAGVWSAEKIRYYGISLMPRAHQEAWINLYETMVLPLLRAAGLDTNYPFNFEPVLASLATTHGSDVQLLIWLVEKFISGEISRGEIAASIAHEIAHIKNGATAETEVRAETANEVRDYIEATELIIKTKLGTAHDVIRLLTRIDILKAEAIKAGALQLAPELHQRTRQTHPYSIMVHVIRARFLSEVSKPTPVAQVGFIAAKLNRGRQEDRLILGEI